MAYRRGSGAVSPGAAQPLPQGGAKQVNDLVETIAPPEGALDDVDEEDEGDVEVELDTSSGAAEGEGRNVGRPASGSTQPSRSNIPGLAPEYQSFLTKPTARPGEPITAGMPFGEGVSSPTAILPETDAEVRKDIARKLLVGTSSARVKSFAARILRGE